ncbi:MAG: hypothetical protein ABIP89_12520 [Polyangiaceae bacterium]
MIRNGRTVGSRESVELPAWFLAMRERPWARFYPTHSFYGTGKWFKKMEPSMRRLRARDAKLTRLENLAKFKQGALG